MKILKNNQGITLVELLVTIVIAFSIMGIVTGVLMQSFRNMEIADKHATLRQEANIVLAMFTKAHMSSITTDPASNGYTVNYRRTNSDWELSIGDQLLTSQNYDVNIELEQLIPGESVPRKFTVTSTTNSASPISIIKRQPLKVKMIKLIDKKDHTKTFELSTIISRL